MRYFAIIAEIFKGVKLQGVMNGYNRYKRGFAKSLFFKWLYAGTFMRYYRNVNL